MPIVKQLANELAIHGGQPAFEQPLFVGRPNVGSRERFLARIERMFDNRWLTNNGPLVQEFEARLAQLMGVRHCVAMCNATIGLEIAIRALGFSGEVIVPSFTFVATAHALQWQAITPVFADVDPVTHCLDPAAVERLITPRTTGIVGVHVWGRPCVPKALEEVAKKHGLPLLFDAAHALGCSAGGQMIGNFGQAEVFSFHATKFVNAFEGGAVTTNDDALAEKMKLMRNFGFVNFDTVNYLGTNGKMSEASAAMGLTSLESLDDFVAVNRRNHAEYRRHLTGMPGINFISYDDRERSNYQYVVLELDEAQCGVSRNRLFEILHRENVIARRYFYPGCHRMEPYRTMFPDAAAQLPETEKLCQKVLVLPTGTAVSAEEIAAVCAIIRVAAKP